MTTWYTADPHFGHANIIKLCDRPFADLNEMHAAITERWNGVVKPADTVWVLGDVALSIKNLVPVARLNGHKILVAGNHDSCWAGHKRWRRELVRYIDAGFAEIHEEGIVREHRLGGTGPLVDLAHLPYAGDSHETDRYAHRRPDDCGRPLLCGHVHNAWKNRGNQLNVGMDVWNFQPVSEELVRVEINGLAADGHIVTAWDEGRTGVLEPATRPVVKR